MEHTTEATQLGDPFVYLLRRFTRILVNLLLTQGTKGNVVRGPDGFCNGGCFSKKRGGCLERWGYLPNNLPAHAQNPPQPTAGNQRQTNGNGRLERRGAESTPGQRPEVVGRYPAQDHKLRVCNVCAGGGREGALNLWRLKISRPPCSTSSLCGLETFFTRNFF